LAIKLVHFNPILFYWVNSEFFCRNIEKLFILHKPSPSDIVEISKNLYLPLHLLNNGVKEIFNNKMSKILNAFNNSFKLFENLFLDMARKGVVGDFLIDIYQFINNLLDELIKKNILYTQALSDKKEELTHISGVYNLCMTLLKFIEIEVFDSPIIGYPIQFL